MRLGFKTVASCKGEAAGIAQHEGQILFCAVDESRILSYQPETGEVGEFRRYTSRTTSLALGPGGRVYGTQSGSRRVVQYNPDGTTSTLTTRLDGRIHNHPRDLSLDAAGRIWFADPYSPIPAMGPQVFPRLDHASVLRLRQLPNRHWTLERMTEDTTHPVAVQVARDSRTLFVSENDPALAGRREVRAYPIRDDGSLGRPSTIHTFGQDHRGAHGGAWGMCLDQEGNLWVCAGARESGPGPMLLVFTAEGQLLDGHPLPEAPSDCWHAGSDVYVTTFSGELLRSTLD